MDCEMLPCITHTLSCTQTQFVNTLNTETQCTYPAEQRSISKETLAEMVLGQ